MTQKENTKCALCGNNAEKIQNSHFFPKFVYRELAPMLLEGHEKIITYRNNAKPLFKEIKSYLLCHICEELFTKNGENYVAKKWRKNKQTNISDLLLAYLKRCSMTSNLSIFHDITDLDDNYLFYFASSMFWRATFNWTCYDRLSLSDSLVDELKNYLLLGTQPQNYKIVSVPIYMVDAYSLIFPKKYGRKDFISGEFYYFTMLNHCFILIESHFMSKFLKNMNSNISGRLLYHIDSKILQEGILYEFIDNYKKSNRPQGLKYTTNLKWINKYIYRPSICINGSFKLNLSDELQNKLRNIHALGSEKDYYFFAFIEKYGHLSPYAHSYLTFKQKNIAFSMK
ncbi:hypothetical protein ACU7RR_000880 [Providencia stuartii]|uniref:HNH endonuclease n=1 Tax=Providencia stuartii (strain MRSN 2154) TaxID=1157951 RepID=A0A140SSZ0_PROSM|nr:MULTISPECIES: hypothetical protein [Providencia]AFH95554.1 hypothetical protein S70_18765 [Providencia stuartii MRSN 2154]MDE8745146.1 hypothetical protein [Providencia thailandensis]MDE8764623.1 hypothetical protein [Providencia thailandensis]MDE8777126.1 hypothetical protein [Providencia thailandensis]MDE8781115.1 hypothetical protein [Providencia thailandensis]